MFEPQIWLRPGQPGATAFSIFFDATNGDGAMFKAEISPSQFTPAMIEKLPSDLLIYGLRGRGIIETSDGATVTIGVATSARISANTRFSWRNELRDVWSVLCFLPSGACVSFLDSMPLCAADAELLDEAKAHGCELYLPPLEPALPAPILALENRISYPMAAYFSL